jgi:hypothetical protein
MAPDADPEFPVYSAFLSYSRRDAEAAHRIHSRLEGYHLPSRLHPRTGVWNSKTNRLKPLFRDLDEMTVAPDISAAISEAIASSAYLIVLCSPDSAKSDWVGREIEMFRAAHGDANILAAVVDGIPETAFHPALLQTRGGGLIQPLAADFRREGDGPRLALLKLVAVMAGIGLGEMVRRDTQRRLRQLALAATAILVVLGIVASLVVMAQRSSENAAEQSARAGKMSDFMLDDLRTKLKRYGNLGMLADVNEKVMETYRGRDLAGLDDAELQQLAKLRLAIGDDAEQRGDLAGARAQFVEAARITAAQLAAAPDNPQRIFDHAQSQYYLALIGWRAGDGRAAQAGFNTYRSLAEKLVAKDAKNPDWWREVGYAELNLGMYALRSKLDTINAERHFRTGLAALETATRLAPNNRDDNNATTDAYAWLGDTLRLRGDYAGAQAVRERQRQLLETMRAADPRDKKIQGYLVANDLAMARIASATGAPDKALQILARGREAAAALARDDPANVRRASQVRIFDLFTLRTWLALPASARPSATAMAAANGDCSNDQKVLRSDELAEFCEILKARRTGTGVVTAVAAPVNRLSERWGLDFAQERRLESAR